MTKKSILTWGQKGEVGWIEVDDDLNIEWEVEDVDGKHALRRVILSIEQGRTRIQRNEVVALDEDPVGVSHGATADPTPQNVIDTIKSKFKGEGFNRLGIEPSETVGEDEE